MLTTPQSGVGQIELGGPPLADQGSTKAGEPGQVEWAERFAAPQPECPLEQCDGGPVVGCRPRLTEQPAEQVQVDGVRVDRDRMAAAR
jgi:hypothetical protein